MLVQALMPLYIVLAVGQGLLSSKSLGHTEKTIKEFAVVQGTCLHVSNGKVVLKNTHEYFYQVQTVMAVLNVPYLDFFMLTSVDEHLERIDFDSRHFHDCLVFLETVLSPKYSRNVC